MVDQGPNSNNPLSLEQLVQNINNIAQILGRLTSDLENGTALLWQPLNSLLTSISALSAIGTAGQFLKATGTPIPVAWADAMVSVALQVFVASGTYTPTTGMLLSLEGTIGSGAGGGGVANTGAGAAAGGGGGGGGSLSLALKTAAQVGASQVVTIGASAAGGSAGSNNGTAGNDTSIGTLCIGKGGSLGTGGPGAAGGAGGVAGTGDITLVGNSGDGGGNQSIVTVSIPRGCGGPGPWGGKPLAGSVAANTNGAAGANYGAGGCGGVSWNAGGAASGGAGAQGLAFVLDFCKV